MQELVDVGRGIAEVMKSEVASPRWVAVSFTDTGVGILHTNLGRIFGPLFTTKPRRIALGLAIVSALVEGHGGTIQVESEVGTGTIFTVRLPVRAEEKEAAG